jgi:hypothetical protein
MLLLSRALLTMMLLLLFCFPICAKRSFYIQLQLEIYRQINDRELTRM